MARHALAAAAAIAALLAAPTAGRAQVADLTWTLDGYYRARGLFLTNLAPEPRYQVTHPATRLPVVMPDIRRTSYLTHRLRLNPTVAYKDAARLMLQVDGIDDVLWGDNNAVSSAPLFATSGSNQYYLGGGEVATLGLTRAWTEFRVPVGLMRVGRMPSHWGLGLLANGGGSGLWDPAAPPGVRRPVSDSYFANDFGDSHFGSTNDRILFATRPLTIYKTIRHYDDVSSNLLVAYAFDKLSEAPFYFGEEDRRTRPFGQQGYLSRGAAEDDANEHVLVVAYSDGEWNRVAPTDELRVGTYFVLRTQQEGFTEPSSGPPNTPDECAALQDPADCVTADEGSLVWIGDLWWRVRYGSILTEGEAYYIGGETTGGIPFPGANHRKQAAIAAGVARAGVTTERYDALLEAGYASGDDDLKDRQFKQRAIHPDYHVGLILFPEVLRERSARVFGPNYFSDANPDGVKGFMSNGGVINARYLHPKVRYRPPGRNVELVGALLFAWLDRWSETPNLFVCPDSESTAADCKASRYLGTEIDLAVKTRFAHEHMDFSLETGYLLFGDALKTETRRAGQALEDAPAGAFTLQARVAFVF